MLSWDDFLKKVADKHGLFDGDDRKAFLTKFAQESLDESKSDAQVATSLNISEVTLQRRLGKVYEAFHQSCPNLKSDKKGKFQTLRDWLKREYGNYQEPSNLTIDWREICTKVLTTQHLRRQATAQQYELNIYVPLGLMERPKTPNPRRNATGEESPPQKEPELQIVQTYKDDAFFQKVIAENHTEKGKHIAIIGEPGAGKTTLLGELAERLAKNSPNFPICIRLADLRDSTIADYLLNNWLSKALQFIDFDAENVTPEIRKEFKQLFAGGKVWLLLDGVDEMAASSPIEALARIREQLTDWVGKARVVLTCRLNVWDAAISNTLTNFDTYKTLEFEPDDVDEFIRQWFEEASQDEKRRNCRHETFWREQGKRLTRELKEPGKERIKELVRNPLRLSMLCQSWCVPEQELPETKAALYEQFTTYFFEWKQEEFEKKQRVLNQRDKKQIQQALAKLALAAMESVNRFRIEQDFAIEQMEEEWFNLADELGWLVLVDRDTRTKKPVYAFFHPTFQEYFAACAIEDWHFFLLHQIPPVSSGSYRIFERQWREVILLWLGRGDVKTQQKEEFIKALVAFEDGCGNSNFYWYRAYFLAAAGITEFKCSKADEIVSQIVKWGFGYLDAEEQTWIEFLAPIEEGAREALVYTKSINAVDALLDLLKFCHSLTPHVEAICYLGDIGQQNPKAISALVQLVESGEDEYSRRYAAENLGKIDPKNPKAVFALLELIKNSPNEQNRMEAAFNLAYVDPDNSTPIATLVRILETCQDENMRMRTAESLNEIEKGNPKAVDTLVDLIQKSQNEDILKQTARIIGEIGKGNQKVVSVLIELIDKSQNEDTKIIAVDSLGKVGESEPKAINALVNLTQNYKDNYILNQALYQLGVIAQKNSNTENAIVEFIQKYSGENEKNRMQAIDSLGKSSKHNPIVVNALKELIQKAQDEFIRWRAAHSLLLIDKNDPLALATLVELTQPNADENTRLHSARSLWLIDKNNPVALNTFLNLLYTAEDESTFFSASHILSKVTQNNFLQINVLLNLLLYSINYHIFYEEFEYLKNILDKSMMLHVVKVLKDCLLEDNIYVYDFGRYESCYDIIWHCTQNLPYPEFYQAWHQDTLTNTATANLNIANLPQVIAEAINNQPELCSKVKLICIDTHQIIDPENPAPEIYDLMLNQNCPEWQNGYPETMQKLKLYWNYLRRNSENPLFFICYDSTALTATPTGFSDTFLKALSKFDGAICVVWETGEIGLQTFSPSQPNLIANIVGWMREKMRENL